MSHELTQIPDERPDAPWWRRRRWLAMALIVLTFAAYWPAIQEGGFIWDDDDYVQQNETLRDIGGLKEIWTSPQATPQYYPLVHTSYWIEYRIWELDPTGYHVTNVILHAIAALLLWQLLRWLSLPGAWLAAALFALHPIHVESVAWITERKNVLSAVFYLASASAYLKWAAARESGGAEWRRYALALALFVAALLSKTVTTSLPAALLLVAWRQQGLQKEDSQESKASTIQWWKSRVIPLLPFFVIGIGFSLLTVWLEKHHVGAKGADWDLSFIDRCLIAGRALWFYIGKLLWPAELCFNYTRWDVNAAVWWQYLYPLAFAALIMALWHYRRRVGRGPLVAMLFFAGSLFPALGFIDVYPMRYSFVADHFAYLANIGVMVLVAVGLHRVGKLLGSRAAQGATAAILLASLALLSSLQCHIYEGLEALWYDTIEKNPASFMSYNNLGQIRLHEGRLEEAVELLETSLELNPDETTAINNLGVAWVGLGQPDAAIAQYRKAISTDPEDPQAYHNLGALMAKQGRREAAVEYYRKALERDDSLAATHINLGMSLAEAGKIDEAEASFKKALELEPDFATAHLKYGEMLQSLGRIRAAQDQYRLAASKDPSLATAHNYLGVIAFSDQLLEAALDHFHDALDAAPGFAETHRNIGRVMASAGRIAVAGEHYRRALGLAPESISIRLEYAELLLRQGDATGARREARSIFGSLPNDPELLYRAALLEQQVGLLPEAEIHLKKAVQLAPDHAPYQNRLAVLLASRGQHEQAVQLLRKAVRLDPKNAEFHNNLGVILVRAGQASEGLKALEEAVKLKPDYAEAQRNLNDLRNRMNRPANP